GETWFQFVKKPKSLLSKRERKGVDGAVVTLEQILDQLNLAIANPGKIFLVRAHITSAQLEKSLPRFPKSSLRSLRTSVLSALTVSRKKYLTRRSQRRIEKRR